MKNEHIPLHSMSTDHAPVSTQPTGKQTPAPSIRQDEITFTALRSLGKELVRTNSPSNPIYDIVKISKAQVNEADGDDSVLASVENVRKAWENTSQGLLKGHTKSNDTLYVNAASKALFFQWEAEKLKSKFMGIVECKLEGEEVAKPLSGSFETESPKTSQFEEEFEKLIDEIYKHTKSERKLLPTDSILNLLLPTYSIDERKKVLAYMYKSREVPSADQTKENLQIFAQSPSSYKLVVVVKDGKKYIEAQKTTFIEWFLQFFNLKITNWNDVFAFLKDTEVSTTQKRIYFPPQYSKKAQKFQDRKIEFTKLIKENTGVDVTGFTHEDLVTPHNEAVRILFYESKDKTKDPTTLETILQLEDEIRKSETECVQFEKICGISWDEVVEENEKYSEKEMISMIQWYFSQPQNI